MSRVVAGINAIRELLMAGKSEILSLYVCRLNQRVDEIIKMAKNRKLEVKFVQSEELERLTGRISHQGVAAVVMDEIEVDLATFLSGVKEKEKDIVLILDSITDPRNLGAIARSAEAFGVYGMVLQKKRATPITAVAFHTACGAFEHLKVARVTNLVEAMKKLKRAGFWTYGAEAGMGIPLYDFKPTFPLAIVLGSEGKGLRELVKKTCDGFIHIPLKGKINSLNVASAASVLLYELDKKRSTI